MAASLSSYSCNSTFVHLLHTKLKWCQPSFILNFLGFLTLMTYITVWININNNNKSHPLCYNHQYRHHHHHNNLFCGLYKYIIYCYPTHKLTHHWAPPDQVCLIKLINHYHIHLQLINQMSSHQYSLQPPLW